MKLMIRAHDLGVKGEEQIASEISRLGLDGVQLVAYKSLEGVGYTEGAIDAGRAREVGSIISEAGQIALLGAYFNPVHPNDEKRLHGIKMFREYIKLAADFGAKTVGSETGSYMGDPWGYHPDNLTDEALDLVVETFTSLADYAAECGVDIGIEGAFNHVCTTPDRLFKCVERIGRKNVRFIFDLYNYLAIGNYTEAYDILDRGHELFGDRILLYHIKDFTVLDGKLKQCGVGQGILDFNKILNKIYAQNPEAILVLEGTVGEDIPYAVEHLKKIIKTLKAE